MDGFINLNKDIGRSSHDAVAAVRRLLNEKTGHAGTLDPGAVGVLPICLGKATRLAEYIALYPKTYRGEVIFGLATDSYDSDGEVTERRSAAHLKEEDILSLLPRFTGQIMQRPPMVSALKYQGQPLYKLARQGREIEREKRPVTVHELKYLGGTFGAENPRVTLEITCSKGTYIRSIAHDLGEALGVGAHLDKLCRLAVGPFEIGAAVTIAELSQMVEKGQSSFLWPLQTGVSQLPRLVIGGNDLLRVAHGNAIFLAAETKEYDICRVEDREGRLLAIGSLTRLGNGSKLVMKKVLIGENDAE